MRILFCLLLLTACNRSSVDSTAFFTQTNSEPTIAVLAVEDEACTLSSLKIADLLTAYVTRSVEQTTPLALLQDKRDARYQVNMQLIELQEIESSPSELSMSILLKVFDTRSGKVLLQEVLSVSTLLDKPLKPGANLSQNNKEFRISPLGLSSAKLSRKIASRIEEAILTKGRTN
ncbi:MAG: hypothetical protein P0S96_03295 [Simkaniaceae bacterium]|nr:hypothetical protein [Candidatus Sacchlamyda saccharinae]